MQLTEELSDTVTALSRGEIDYPKAAALVVGVRGLNPPDGCADAVTGEVITPDGIRRGLVTRVERRVLPKAGARSLRQHREAIERAIAAVAPRTTEQRHQSACDARRVEFRTEADGMAWLSVYGPAVDLTAVKVMLDAAADAAHTDDPDEPRSRDQLRVDILTQLAWTILEDGHLPNHRAGDSGEGDGDREPEGAGTDAHGERPDGQSSTAEPGTGDGGPNGCGCAGAERTGGGSRATRRQARRLARRHRRAVTVNVTVPLTTLLGLDDRPAELDGYGPITA